MAKKEKAEKMLKLFREYSRDEYIQIVIDALEDYIEKIKNNANNK